MPMLNEQLTDYELTYIDSILPDRKLTSEEKRDIQEECYWQKTDSDYRALLSTHPDNKTLISTYGKEVIIEICKEKLLGLTTELNHELKEYKRCSTYTNIRGLTGPVWALSFEYRQEYISDLKKQIDKFSLLYLIATDKLPKSKNGLTDVVIQQARTYPTHELYSGKLIRSGRNFRCLCPFHEERTPSFYFYEAGSWHCFGCAAHGGNAIDYLIKLEHLSFKEVVGRLT